jgi:hypothetical protein
METFAGAVLWAIVILFVGLTGIIIIFLGAVWFGLFIVAPRIRRALDRADADEEEPGDRPD